MASYRVSINVRGSILFAEKGRIKDALCMGCFEKQLGEWHKKWGDKRKGGNGGGEGMGM